MVRKTLVSMALVFAVGCTTTRPIALLAPEKRSELMNSSQTVVEGTLVNVISKADMTVSENLDPGGSPSRPANGWKHDYEIKVDHVVKGVCNDTTLTLHDTKNSDTSGGTYSQLGILPGAKVYVGWQSESGGRYSGLMLVRAEDVAATQTMTTP